MSTHKRIDQICVAAIISAVIICILFMNGAALGIKSLTQTKGYEETLFDTSKVHTIDIEMDDWDEFIAGCEDEEYVPCTIVIDNDAVKNVGIRAKGNTSLSTVSQLNSDRYSFKVEFDHYQDGKNYNGLDKLSLNNIIQDNTYMKDYLSYQMMNAFDVDAPLCSYAWITVNGEAWGLYLAVEGIEDSFLERNYGSESGVLYKPDSTSQGGGRGNGKKFDMDEFNADNSDSSQDDSADQTQTTQDQSSNDQQNNAPPNQSDDSGQSQNMQMPGNIQMPENPGDMPDMSQLSDGEMPDLSEMTGNNQSQANERPGNQQGGNNGGGNGSDDVKLRYIDDNVSSYSNIFDNVKTNVTAAEQERLIESLQSLSQNEDIEGIINTDEVIRYFVVHNYVVNGDSYTGGMVHNYYLYDDDGQLSMIPWDYNLAFGGFQGGEASSAVNDPIDTPLSVSSSDDRPMFTWITKNKDYLELYHAYYTEFLESVDIQGMIDDAYNLIKDYVDQDPTKFCTTEEFETGVKALKNFCELRSQSISGQLDGTIPSTDDGQSADSSKLIDASSITLSDMGSMNAGGGMDQKGQQMPGQSSDSENSDTVPTMPTDGQSGQNDQNLPSGNMTPPDMGSTNDSKGSNQEQANSDSGNTQQQISGENQKTDGGGMQQGSQTESSQSQTKPSADKNTDSDSGSTLLLLSAAILILAAGIIFAFKVK